MYVLDTNVVSEFRRTRPHGAVLAWMERTRDADIFISAATVGEIQTGIERTRDSNIEHAAEIERWLREVVLSMNVISPDAQTFRIWAKLMHRRQSQLWDDAMIAATAIQHHATVVTRNVRDFELFEVEIINPFS